MEILSVEEDGILGAGAKAGESRRRSLGSGRKPVLPNKEQLFWLLVQLCRVLDEVLMTNLVGRSQVPISCMVLKWLNYLYVKLGSRQLWATPDVVKANLPACYRGKYDKTFAIIDCTEIRCEVPSSLPLQLQMYSFYKSHTTLKTFVAISPAGAVIFVVGT